MTSPGSGRVAAALIVHRLRDEWRATPFYTAALRGPRTAGLASAPRDFRPPDPQCGRAVLEGRFAFAGTELRTGAGGDPWNQPSPSRLLAVKLHRFAWLPDLLSLGDEGAMEALRLWLAWEALFGRVPDAFSWGADVLERRLFNLACGSDALARAASEAEAAAL
ncbi:MAG: heparinase, partial [Caulobacteraceae bacterium]|nr:heparinase [Caulobacter sp.]